MKKPKMKKVKVLDGDLKNHTIQEVRENMEKFFQIVEQLDLKKIDFKFAFYEKREVDERDLL